MALIDTHIHLYDSAFDADLEEAIQRSIDSGITKVILPGIDSSCYERLMSLAERYPDYAYPTIGLHPTSIDSNWEEELKHVKDHLDARKHYAIGEIGLDGYWSKEYMEAQKIAFKDQIELAVEHDLPVIIHLRDATEELFEVLDNLNKETTERLRGVFHAFSGSYEIYQRVKKYGDFKFGIGGVVTYKKASIAETIKYIPLEDLVLETDAPWLTPTPYRGKRNEASYVKYIAEKIAEIKECSIEEVASITTANAQKLFNIF